MPDFERLTDRLLLDMSKDHPVKHAWANGYVAGKKKARTEVLVVAAVITAVAVVVQLI